MLEKTNNGTLVAYFSDVRGRECASNVQTLKHIIKIIS